MAAGYEADYDNLSPTSSQASTAVEDVDGEWSMDIMFSEGRERPRSRRSAFSAAGGAVEAPKSAARVTDRREARRRND